MKVTVTVTNDDTAKTITAKASGSGVKHDIAPGASHSFADTDGDDNFKVECENKRV